MFIAGPENTTRTQRVHDGSAPPRGFVMNPTWAWACLRQRTGATHRVRRLLGRVGTAGVAILAFAGLSPEPARAAVVYEFQSGNYTNVTNPYTTSMGLSTRFTLPSALPANATVDASTLALFEWSGWNDGTRTMFGDPRIEVTTDLSGLITRWDLTFFTSSLTDTSARSVKIADGSGYTTVLSDTSNAAYRFTPGTWTVSSVASVPEPPTLLLAAAGLPLMLALNRRRHRGNASSPSRGHARGKAAPEAPAVGCARGVGSGKTEA